MIAWVIAVPLLVGLGLVAARAWVPGHLAAVLGAVTMACSGVATAVLWDGGPVSGGVDVAWIDAIGARFSLGITALSLPFMLMTALLGALCCVWLVARGTSTALVGLIQVVCANSLGVFAAQDLLLFLIFFELVVIPMWFVIAWWGDPADRAGRRRAATTFLLYTVGGSALLLVAIVMTAREGDSLQFETAMSTSLVAAVLVAIAFAIKIPLLPVHGWLPDAHSKAPTVGSVLLAGVLLKLGTYGLLFFAYPMIRLLDVAPYLAALGALGIVWSALACHGQSDLKRLIAYSSVGHMGFVALAISTHSPVGVAAAVFGSVAHGLITAMLFFAEGALRDRLGSTAWGAVGRGLYARMPWVAVALAFAALASLGLPGLAGFWGELLSLRAAYELGVLPKQVAWTALILALVGIALTTSYMVRALRLVAQGEPTPRDGDAPLRGREKFVFAVLAVAILALGLMPGLLLDLYDPLKDAYWR
jgi:NADH-quinone oxidoreductase subunit M